MLNGLAMVGVLLTGLYLVGLAVLSFLAPERARRFLHGFAGSARVNYIELAVRLLAGGAFVQRAPFTMFPWAFSLFGWALIITTACLLAIPWRWHRRIAPHAVPHASRRLGLFALASLALGSFVLVTAAIGPTVWATGTPA